MLCPIFCDPCRQPSKCKFYYAYEYLFNPKIISGEGDPAQIGKASMHMHELKNWSAQMTSNYCTPPIIVNVGSHQPLLKIILMLTRGTDKKKYYFRWWYLMILLHSVLIRLLYSLPNTIIKPWMQKHILPKFQKIYNPTATGNSAMEENLTRPVGRKRIPDKCENCVKNKKAVIRIVNVFLKSLSAFIHHIRSAATGVYPEGFNARGAKYHQFNWAVAPESRILRANRSPWSRQIIFSLPMRKTWLVYEICSSSDAYQSQGAGQARIQRHQLLLYQHPKLKTNCWTNHITAQIFSDYATTWTGSWKVHSRVIGMMSLSIQYYLLLNRKTYLHRRKTRGRKTHFQLTNRHTQLSTQTSCRDARRLFHRTIGCIVQWDQAVNAAIIRVEPSENDWYAPVSLLVSYRWLHNHVL